MRRFAWRLPDIQPFRLATALLQWARHALQVNSSNIWKLPTFHLPYYEELLRATDDEDTRRVMLHCIRDARTEDGMLTNLLTESWLASGDILVQPLKLLAETYSQFIAAAHEKGLHVALFGGEWAQLRQAYKDCYETVTKEAQGTDSQMTAMLLRCFLAVQKSGPENAGVAWGTEPYERSGIATILHPAVLEMLEAQVLFLFSCFNAAAVVECRRENRAKAFSKKIWDGYVDLASIQSPLAGLLCNEDLNLDTNVRGQELIHRIGSPAEQEAALSTRLLTRYDGAGEDEEVTDAEMFRDSREAKLLFRFMMDYFRLHPHARDGLSLAVFRNQDIQPVIAAVHQYLDALADEKNPRYGILTHERRKPYAISVTIFTESGDDVGVARWIEQWRERWEAAETEKKFNAYRYCRFSVAHRVIETRRPEDFRRLVALIRDSFVADMAVLYNFIGAGQGGNRFADVAPFDITTRTLKFPILEKSYCAVRHPTDSYKRARVISNRQFCLGTLHTEVMNRLKNPGLAPGTEHVVLGHGDFAPWRGAVDALHEKAEWVVCIDPNMDERLIRKPTGEGAAEREIIGFGSGVGSHGEANFTISTQQFSLADIHVRLAASIQEVYSHCNWGDDDCRELAKNLLQQTGELSGLSLVRATGVGNYIREFMAYPLTRKMLREKNAVPGKALLCDYLVSLDAYSHWFDMADSGRRPDLMWLVAWLGDDGRLHLDLRLVECKLAQQADEHLKKAQTQINNGLEVLMPLFAPWDDAAAGEDNRPDRRYWWLQLHRLIASKALIEPKQQAGVLSALERLAEGDYGIHWGAAVFAFWTDVSSATPSRVGQWATGPASDVTANIFVMGSGFVHAIAVGNSVSPMTWEEWNANAVVGCGNVCTALEDIVCVEDDDEDSVTPPTSDIEEDGNGGRSGEGLADEFLPLVVPDPEMADEPVALPAKTADAPVQAPQVTVAASADSGVGGSNSAIPDRILLGKTVTGDKPIYWEFGHKGLDNRHFLIFGTAGTGKTYSIQSLLCELGRAGQNSLIMDYTQGFFNEHLEPGLVKTLNPLQHFILEEPMTISPFRRASTRIGERLIQEADTTAAQRVASVFCEVYAMGDQQRSALYEAVKRGVGVHKNDMTLSLLITELEKLQEDGGTIGKSAGSVISKIKPFVDMNPFGQDTPGSWNGYFQDSVHRCHVLQLAGFMREAWRIVVEFALFDMYAFYRMDGSQYRPRVVVLDEFQDLDQSEDGPLAQLLRQGRKFGFSLILATQIMSNLKKDERDRLFNSGHKLFFKPAMTEVGTYADLLATATKESKDKWRSVLSGLQKGECISFGPALNETTGDLRQQAFKIRIPSLAERGFHG